MDDGADASRRRFVRTELITLALAAPAMFGITVWFGGLRDSVQLLLHAPLQILGGHAAMLLAVLLAAGPLGRGFDRNPALLGIWNVALFAFGAVTACAINWLVLGMGDAGSWFRKPLLLLLTFGLLPAIVIGHLAVLIHMLQQRRS
ncbi:MAG: hypothetical protein MUC36_03690 [Planctomycetes bacterium]|nr:hypothetical protein [Planctomycetota bacterium]